MKKKMNQAVNNLGRRQGMSWRLLELLQQREGWWHDHEVSKLTGLPLSVVRPALHYLRRVGAVKYRKQIQYRLDGRKSLDRLLKRKKK